MATLAVKLLLLLIMTSVCVFRYRMSEMKREDMRPEEEEELEELDSRVEQELEELNDAANLINEIEPKVGAALRSLQSFLVDAAKKLERFVKKHPKSVKIARPYFELVQRNKELEQEVQDAVSRYVSANDTYEMAKQTLQLADHRMSQEDGETVKLFMRHARLRFMDSAATRNKVHEEHQRLTNLCSLVQKKMKVLEKENPRKIKCARPYFELQERVDTALKQASETVADLKEEHEHARKRYRQALKNLEDISLEIHQSRK